MDILKLDQKYDINVNNVLIFNRKIGLISGNKDNPLNHVYFYNKND